MQTAHTTSFGRRAEAEASVGWDFSEVCGDCLGGSGDQGLGLEPSQQGLLPGRLDDIGGELKPKPVMGQGFFQAHGGHLGWGVGMARARVSEFGLHKPCWVSNPIKGAPFPV